MIAFPGKRAAGLLLTLTATAWIAASQPAAQSGDVIVRLETSYGAIDIAVDTTHAPITAANFLKYVDGGFYTNGRFHRATRADNYTVSLPNRPMMEIIQG